MKTVKKILGLVPPFVLWAMGCVLIWGYVFTLITDAPVAEKLTLYVDAEVPGGTALASVLEEELAGRARMVQVRPFTYAMFDGDSLKGADLLIVKASDMETYRDWFAPLPQAFREEKNLYESEGAVLGVRAYDGTEGRGVTTEYIRYQEKGQGREDYYLTFGALSLHNLENENAVDDLALEAAKLLLTMK